MSAPTNSTKIFIIKADSGETNVALIIDANQGFCYPLRLYLFMQNQSFPETDSGESHVALTQIEQPIAC